MTQRISYKEKLGQYEKGQYRFKAPPVCTARWDTDAWIKFIDAYNGWYNIREADEIFDEDLEAAADYFDRL